MRDRERERVPSAVAITLKCSVERLYSTNIPCSRTHNELLIRITITRASHAARAARATEQPQRASERDSCRASGKLSAGKHPRPELITSSLKLSLVENLQKKVKKKNQSAA